MGVKCEERGGGGAFILQCYGGVILSTGWPSCTPRPPLRLFSQSVNGHLCVNNPTLVLFYHGCLLEVQHGGGSSVLQPQVNEARALVPAWVGRFISQYSRVALVWRGQLFVSLAPCRTLQLQCNKMAVALAGVSSQLSHVQPPSWKKGGQRTAQLRTKTGTFHHKPTS